MASLRSGWVVTAAALVGGLVAGCGVETDSATDVSATQSALVASCAADSDCSSGFVCWTSGNSCVRASSCSSSSTGPGVFVGTLAIDSTDTALDLQSLGNAWCVTGDVSVKKTALTDLSGLGSLITVNGNVAIEDNPALVSLQGLAGVRRITQLSLMRNPLLESLVPLSKLDTLVNLQLYINPKLTSLSGLQSVTRLSGAEIVNNAGLTSLAGLDSVASVFSYIDVRLNPQLTNLVGLGSLASVGNSVQITDNAQLQSLDGLGKLATTNTLRVMRNRELDHLRGLAKLTSVRTFQVEGNPQLDSCNVSALASSVAADCSGCLRNGPCPPPDNCPDDPAKLEPGACGCGVADLDTDSDGVADCQDTCTGHDDRVDVDRNGTADGCQECVTAATCDDGDPRTTESCIDTHCTSAPTDFCPDDPAKLEPGRCGCGIADLDSDADGIVDCQDACAGHADQVDVDRNGIPDGCQECVTAATCDDESPATTESCVDAHCVSVPTDFCPEDPAKLEPGGCGCGTADLDTDSDGVLDCRDTCAGHDDHVDVDQNGIPDGCQQCVTAAACDDHNPCTTDACVATACRNTINTGASCGEKSKCSAAGACVEQICKFQLISNRYSYATGVSDDGRIVTGTALGGSYIAPFRWTAPNSLTTYYPVGSGKAISGDGRYIAGSTSGLGPLKAFYGEGGRPTFAQRSSSAYAMSADGRFVVGTMDNVAYRWEAFMANPTLINPGNASVAYDISADGSVIVGVGTTPKGPYGAFVYRDGTTIGLGDFSNRPNQVNSEATAVSPNGQIVVGRAIDGLRSYGFRWTAEEGLVKLAAGLAPQAVTDSGMILGVREVIGSSLGDGDLSALLTGCGISLQSTWSLEAADMTPDGRTIVGAVKTDAQPYTRAFVAQLP